MIRKLEWLVYPSFFLLLCFILNKLSFYLENRYSLLLFTRKVWPTLVDEMYNLRFVFLFSLFFILIFFFIKRNLSFPKDIIMTVISLGILIGLYGFFVVSYYPFFNIKGYEACASKSKIPGEYAPIDSERLKIEDFIKQHGKYSDVIHSEGYSSYFYNSRSVTYTCKIEVNSDGIIEHYWLDVML